MLRIFCLALIVAFLGSITPSFAQGTGGSPGHALKHKTATVHNRTPIIMMKHKKHHLPKAGKKGSAGTNAGGHPPK